MEDVLDTPVEARDTTMVVRTYAICERVARQLRFSEHMIRYQGLDLDNVSDGLIWGVYGTRSLNTADSFASMEAHHSRRLLYQIDLSYIIPAVVGRNTVTNAEQAKAGGFFNYERMEVGFRNEIFQRLIDLLPSQAAKNFREQPDKTIQDLLRSHPMLVHRFMDSEPTCFMFTHRVELAGGAELRMITLRNDPSRIKRIRVRYHDEVEVEV